MSTPFWQFPFFIYLYFVCSVFPDMCRSKICCYWKMNSSLWYWKMLFTLWQCRSLFDWLSLLVSQTQLPIRGILQISWFYKTKKVLIKQLQRNFFWVKLKTVKAFSNDVRQFSSRPKGCNFLRRILNLAKQLRRSILQKKLTAVRSPLFAKFLWYQRGGGKYNS